MTNAPTTISKPQRRWFQFSLRTMLIVMLLAGSGMGWFAHRLKQASRQREAVAAIQKLGGAVAYDCELRGEGAPGPVWLRQRLGDDFFTNVTWVNLGRTQVAAETMEQLQQALPNCEIDR
ncbi:MAG: hypothetical protein NTY19_19465 [Planctomycetota bacterium]|nr:hypothetical protein [Planctomycetota bacterium]